MRRKVAWSIFLLALIASSCAWFNRAGMTTSEGGGGSFLRAAPGSNRADVRVTEHGFLPMTLLVTVGTTVVFHDEAAGHPVVVAGDDGSWSSGRMSAGNQFEVTFNRQGHFFYHDLLATRFAGSIDVH